MAVHPVPEVSYHPRRSFAVSARATFGVKVSLAKAAVLAVCTNIALNLLVSCEQSIIELKSERC
jgi:hypothetical protein